MMLPGFRIVDVQSNVENLVLENFLSVSDMSGPAQILGSRSRAALGCCFAERRARSPAIHLVAAPYDPWVGWGATGFMRLRNITRKGRMVA